MTVIGQVAGFSLGGDITLAIWWVGGAIVKFSLTFPGLSFLFSRSQLTLIVSFGFQINLS